MLPVTSDFFLRTDFGYNWSLSNKLERRVFSQRHVKVPTPA